MHKSSYELMESLLEKAEIPDGGTVLDCGSAIAGTGMQVSYRDLFKGRPVEYIGFDAQEGRNVDLVGDIYRPEGGLPRVDLVISGQMLEHLTFPLLAVQRMKAAVKTHGWMILIAPWQYGIHRYPLDCWRVLPDGMEFLFEGFTEFDAGVRGNDCWGVGKRPELYRKPWSILRL